MFRRHSIEENVAKKSFRKILFFIESEIKRLKKTSLKKIMKKKVLPKSQVVRRCTKFFDLEKCNLIPHTKQNPR